MSTEQGSSPRLTKAGPVAQYLGITKARCYELARAGILPCVRLGRSVHFDVLAIEQFVEEEGAAWEHGWRKEVAQ